MGEARVKLPGTTDDYWRKRQVDITGRRYGKLTAVRPFSCGPNPKWIFRCDCGAEKPMVKGNVISRGTGSCGCLKKGSGNGNWKGGEIEDGHGRVLIYSPSHPNPSYCGTHVYRYRLVIEKSLGRYLDPKEIVHHINGDKRDDRLENLQVMSQSEHARLHMTGRGKKKELQ